MCHKCELIFKSIKENLNIISKTLMEKVNYKCCNDIVVQNGCAITNGESIILIDDKYINLYDKHKNHVHVCEHKNNVDHYVKDVIRKNNVNYYNTLYERPNMIQVKLWVTRGDDLVCENCKELEGQVKQENTPFWIIINNKTYALQKPPLHWVFKKDGSKYDTCRCKLERSIINRKDLVTKQNEKRK